MGKLKWDGRTENWREIAQGRSGDCDIGRNAPGDGISLSLLLGGHFEGGGGGGGGGGGSS